PKLTKQAPPDRATISSPLATSAAALESELHRYLDLATVAQRIPLNSEKNLDRAARAIKDAMDSQERVSANVRALFEAITRARGARQREGHDRHRPPGRLDPPAGVLGQEQAGPPQQTPLTLCTRVERNAETQRRKEGMEE